MFANIRHRRYAKKLSTVFYVTWAVIFTLYLYSKKVELEETIEKLKDQRSSRTTAISVVSSSDDDEDPDDLPPGENGEGVELEGLDEHQKELVKKGWESHAFNEYISDMISLRRKLPDVRHKGCRDEDYDDDLPQTSVIICFHNEAWSTLLRTVHSVLDRSPPELIKEIILVDDFSDMNHLGSKLEKYIRDYPKVHLIRADKREGLIRSRMLGAHAATAPVLTFLDSHCECTKGWLQPLLQRIADDYSNVVAPSIDIISDDDFEYVTHEDDHDPSIGGFDWSLEFNWFKIPKHERERRTNAWDPIRTPTIAGGLFAISKRFFERVGMYDKGFDIWGAENLEISFKTWMCGGTLEIIPCSRVGHIFRKRSPYSWKVGTDVFRKNSVRLAEVWMDDYKKHFYERINYDLGDFGDVSERKALRKRLKCKSFDWYVKNVYPDLFIPSQALARGEIRNIADGNDTCLDSESHGDSAKPVKLWPCHKQGGNQFWFMSQTGEIRRDESCLDYSGGENVLMYPCHGSRGNQEWHYEASVQLLRHIISKKCLEMLPDKKKLTMKPCRLIENQMWVLENWNPSVLHSGVTTAVTTTSTTTTTEMPTTVESKGRNAFTLQHRNFLPLPFLKRLISPFKKIRHY